MSLATRCPACDTTFKVVRDQLRISDGWVRCGRCSNVFDGAEHLHESPAPAAATEAASHEEPPQRSEPPAPEPAVIAQPMPAPAPWVSPPSTVRADEAEPPSASARAVAPAEPEAVVDPAVEAADHAVMDASIQAPPGALADIDFFSDALLRLSADALPSGGYAASPMAPPQTITDHIPQPPRSQPVALEAPSLNWPAFTHYAPTTAVPVIEFPLEGAVSDPPAAMARDGDNWSRLPSLHLGEVPRAPLVDALSESTASAPAEADDAQFQKALRRARIKSLKLARARAKAKEGETPAVMLAPSETATEPATIDADDSTAPRATIPSSARVVPLSTRSARSEEATPAQRRLRWRRPLRITALAALLLLLAAQVLHQERNAIVARQPSLRPAFASACEWLGCQLSALRQIADIRIDGASFAREKSGEGYQFSFTLRNLASIPLAMPAVELSLLDTQERTVVRRVLRPADYGAPPTLPAHAERATLLPVLLAGEDATALPRVAGFRLDAFYP